MAEALGIRAGQAIVARLAAMTGDRFFGAPYPNAPTVEMDLRTEEGIARYPHICVWLERTEDRTPMASVGGQQAYLTPYRFKLTGYVRRTADMTPIEWAIRLSEDIELTLRAGYQLGGICHDIGVSPAEFDPELELDAGVSQAAKVEMNILAMLTQVITVTP